MVEGSLARRYANALLEIGKESNMVDRFGEDLVRFSRAIESTAGLSEVMASPVFTQVERRAVLDQVLPGLALHPMVLNFLRLLLEKDRFAALPEIIREYRALSDLVAGRIRAVVTTAAELSPSMRDQVSKALTQSTGKQVVLETRVDPALLGGMVANVGSRVYDASLRTRLERLQLSLVNPTQA